MRSVFVLLLALLSGLVTPASAATIVPLQAIALSAVTPIFQTAPVTINTLTETITIQLRRPTTLSPLAWAAAARIQVTIVITVDGVAHRATSTVGGGIRIVRGVEAPTYRLTYSPTWGFFGATSGLPQRLGQTSLVSYTAHVIVTQLSGTIATDIEATSTEAPAPAVPFGSSVAFDATTNATEVTGDAIISLTHTASGSNRAVFAGQGNSDGTGGKLTTSITYGGAGMTEMWDAVFATVLAHSGYQLANPATGAQTVTATLAAGADEKGLGVVSMTGVDQVSPVGTPTTATGATANPSITVAGVGANDLVVDNLYVDSTSASTPGADQTARWNVTIGGFSRHAGSTQPGTAGGVMSWTQGAANWGLGGVAFVAAAGAGTLRTLTGVGD